MNPRILAVDDDRCLLDALRRTLCRRYDLSLAQGPEDGLYALRECGPFAVVLSDLRMPGMDGIRFLERARELAPDTTRIMLTGHGDLDAAMAAVNEGHVFRFFTKPCPPDVLVRALDAGVEQHRLVTAEKELLRGTLRGCVKVLLDVLGLVSPEAFGRGERVKSLALAAARRMGLAPSWRLELAGMLSQVGLVAVPQEIVLRRFRGDPLTDEQQAVYDMHPSVAAALLGQIPRMGEVTELISRQGDCRLGGECPTPEAALLALCLDLEDLLAQGRDKRRAADSLRQRWEMREPQALRAVLEALFEESGYLPERLPLDRLREGMVLDADLRDEAGTLIMARGQHVSEAALLRLSRLRKSFRLPGEADVLRPLAPSEGATPSVEERKQDDPAPPDGPPGPAGA
ncbi:Hydrogenase transcriptional regulatory protein hupR1 [Fundidesulfovibrio magnetotacticus]|uniref:Hydrogenase transcriptional regulatory protein hupR1 n=1 Tax=Fundidesulfovibrio magnetotacticus TaxID=2730080 RepID=A0A6V8M2E4_9BACT|nr:HD domain-containing phosphohydrolase [Fundidesulfovibrio magnetotacticus]GFK95987.1 Hydrogenase transcriptional regulatory protein hupR1 [Fundidesulfovibrio magnetotacticus]